MFCCNSNTKTFRISRYHGMCWVSCMGSQQWRSAAPLTGISSYTAPAPRGPRRCSVVRLSHAVSLCRGSCRHGHRLCWRLPQRRAGTWAPRAAAPVPRDGLVEAGRYVETALLFLCQKRLRSSTAGAAPHHGEQP